MKKEREASKTGGSARTNRASRLSLMTGCCLALFITMLWKAGLFNTIEGWLVDRRTHWAAPLSPEPSDDVVHVDIDEEALEKIDRWPWNRVDLAHAIDAMRLAGARTVVLDLLIAEHQRERLIGEPSSARVFLDDAALERAMRDAGNVIVACSYESRRADDGSMMLTLRTPIGPVLDASAGMGFVNAGLNSGDTVVRELPAYEDIGGTRVYQLGVVATAHFLGVDPSTIRASESRLTVDRRSVELRDGRLVVPWRPRTDAEVEARREEAASGGRPYVDVDGTPAAWQLVHDRISITELVQVGRVLMKLHEQRARAIEYYTGSRPGLEISEEELREADEGAQSFGDPPELLKEARDELLLSLATLSGTERDRAVDDLALVEALIAWPALRDADRDNEVVQQARATLELIRERLDGKLVVVGWTAKGAIADFYPTALGGRTPGAMVHSAIASGLLTGHWITHAPEWMDLLTTLCMGLMGVLIGGAVRPSVSWLVMLATVIVYCACDIWWWFGAGETIVALAAPVTGCSLSWLGVRLVRAAEDLRERARVTRLFRSRVSSNLVDYLTEHPERMNMEGEQRVLTMCFTDLVGFTSLAEQLGGPDTVRVLNRCLGDLTDEMLERRAYVNKFLGDGIMSFWGAPIEDEHQADHAVQSVVACYEALVRINEDHARDGIPALGMRAGIATGRVVVGDCGAPPKLNDYTVIGDSVNLAARLESANKLLGTQAFVSGATYDALSDEVRDSVLWRHLGCLRVVGQTADIPIHELVILGTEKGAEMKAWIERTHEAVEAYRAGDIEKARPLWDGLSKESRGGAGAVLYREACDAVLAGREEACPALVLRSK